MQLNLENKAIEFYLLGYASGYGILIKKTFKYIIGMLFIF